MSCHTHAASPDWGGLIALWIVMIGAIAAAIVVFIGIRRLDRKE